jgi:hypothetical protein
MRRFLKEPLLHFVVLAAMLFGIFGMFGPNERETPTKIVVTRERVESLAFGFAGIWGRQPAPDEMRDLIDGYIRDEVFYREGKASGFDRDDTVIRRRLRQKMEMLADGAVAAEPSEAQLTAYIAAHPEKFRGEDSFSFRHIFFAPTHHTDDMDGDVARRNHVAHLLEQIKPDDDVSALGDRFGSGAEFGGMTNSDVVRIFGERFAKQLRSLPENQWRGPIISNYGTHFVYLTRRVAGELLPPALVRQAVRQEWMSAQRRDAETALYQSMRRHYEVVIEPASATFPKAGS